MEEKKRKCGILMPVTAIPSEYGIGCFSKEAYEFVDDLAAAGQSCWQILPLGPTSYGDSPYQSFSTFAGNPYFIDPQTLIKKGWITKEECDKYDFGKNKVKIDYGKIWESRFILLKSAFKHSKIDGNADFAQFVESNKEWLEDYAMYMAVKASYDNRSWAEWDDDIRLRKAEAIKEAKEKFAEDILFYEFLQFEFDEEWKALKKYANDKGIEIIGDIPIYVAFDSADAWANPELFQFDEELKPKAVAGCPPDAFSATGQLWGNPLYDWDYHKKTGFEWWMKRLSKCFELYDIVRIDHFRGFDEYYSIPYGAKNAVKGKWRKGPGYALFAEMKKKLGDRPVIAEDLGFLTPSVLKLVKRTGYPGMKILQFAFDSRDDSDYQPHNYKNNCVVYTGTHDNETTRGWFNSINKKDREYAVKYLHLEGVPEDKIAWEFIRAAYMSVADLCVIPMQDFLNLGSEARINEPSTLGKNWQWRMKKNAFSKKLQKNIADLAKLYARERQD